MPRFRGRIGGDVVYVGLSADLATLREGLGSYLVMIERPGAIRFGLDAVAAATPPARWDELAWEHVPAGTFVGSAPPTAPVAPGVLEWGRSSAHMAAITERPAVRLAIHIDELLGENEDG